MSSVKLNDGMNGLLDFLGRAPPSRLGATRRVYGDASPREVRFTSSSMTVARIGGEDGKDDDRAPDSGYREG